MKKITFIIVAMLASLAGFSQDTIRIGDTNYYWAGDTNDFRSIEIAYLEAYSSNGYIRCYSQVPITVKGMSIISNGKIVRPDNSEYTSMYMKIFQKENNNIVLLDSVRISKSDVENAKKAHKYFLYPNVYCGYDYENGRVIDTSFRGHADSLLEFYFDHPIVVRDTFFVGLHMEFDVDDADYDTMIYFNNFIENRIVVRTGHYGGEPERRTESFQFRYRPTTEWQYDNIYRASAFPIIGVAEPDSVPLCKAPGMPRITEVDNGNVTVSWPANSSVSYYEVAFGTDTLNPENNDIVTSLYNGQQFTGLEDNVSYACWVRNICHHYCLWHDTNTYSDWSEPLIFSLTNGWTQPTSISTTSDLQMSIYPNPAKDEVTIEAQGVPMQQLELYDIQGRLLKRVSQMEDKERYQMSVTTLPAGRYVVKAITPFGITTQSFVKQ